MYIIKVKEKIKTSWPGYYVKIFAFVPEHLVEDTDAVSNAIDEEMIHEHHDNDQPAIATLFQAVVGRHLRLP